MSAQDCECGRRWRSARAMRAALTARDHVEVAAITLPLAEARSFGGCERAGDDLVVPDIVAGRVAGLEFANRAACVGQHTPASSTTPCALAASAIAGRGKFQTLSWPGRTGSTDGRHEVDNARSVGRVLTAIDVVRTAMRNDAPLRDEITFDGPIVEWRGPAPFYFVSVPRRHARCLQAMAKHASYGWGCVPVIAMIDATEFRTSLFPKDGSYLLPLKATVRRELGVAPGATVCATIRICSSANLAAAHE